MLEEYCMDDEQGRGDVPMTSHLRVLALAGISVALATPVLAHHSQSEFDFKQKVEVEGKVTRLEWKSPHARLYLDVVNKEGVAENWNFELPSPTTLMRPRMDA